MEPKSPTVYVLSDMEGAFGITSMDQCVPGSDLWRQARVELTREVAAAVEGARAGGAGRVVVHDTHAWGVNLAAELLPAGIELKRCHAVGPVPILGVVPEGCLVFMVAVHVGAGKPGHLPHTFRTRFRRVTVDGRDVGESELYAALLDRVGARVALVTGDRSATDEVREALPWCATVPVPRTGDGAGVLPAIREAAADASAHAERARSFRYPGQVEMAFQFESVAEAQRHRMAPWDADGDWLRHRGPFEEVFRAFLDMAYLGRWAPLRSLAVPLVGILSRWRFER